MTITRICKPKKTQQQHQQQRTMSLKQSLLGLTKKDCIYFVNNK